MTDNQAKALRFATVGGPPGLFCIGSKVNDGYYLLEHEMDENACRSRDDVKLTKILHEGKPLKVAIYLCAACREKRSWPSVPAVGWMGYRLEP